MCGISGIYWARGYGDPSRGATMVRGMVLAQAHRGPDADAVWMSDQGDLVVGHNRLAILDLSPAGNQPMLSSDGRYVIVFNGEIYNYLALKAELVSQGSVFHNSSDTAVLLEAYRVWGEGMLPRLRGMFAFALYDIREKTLFCARDRIGKKPFVYAEADEAFLFGSEIPSVVGALKKLKVEANLPLNQAALSAMLLHNMHHVPDPHTAYRDIKRLRPGHAMMVRAGKVDRVWRYWEPSLWEGEISVPALRALIEEAVALRMQADVPVGALLSGGVDSSAIVALMQQKTDRPVQTYALGLDAADEDLRRARVMADKLGCKHQEFYFDPDRQWQNFQDMIGIYGEPIMLLPLIHAYELCSAIRSDGVRVVLGGHGADELFYGYTGHVRTARLSALMSFVAPLARPFKGVSDQLSVLGADAGHRKAAFYRTREGAAWDGVLQPDARATMRNLAAEELAYWGALCPAKSFIDESNFTSLLVENTHSLTTSSDLPAMMASVEMRAPFLDQDLLSFALATPLGQKVPWIAPQNRLKWILREAVKDLIPHELLYAPKRGFGYGISEHDLLCGAWKEHGDALFAEPHDADGLFDKGALRKLWVDYLYTYKKTGFNASNLVPNLFAIQYWLQTKA